MKNLLSSLVLSCLFLLGTVNVGFTNDLILDGGTELHIYDSKTGVAVCSISVAEKYLDKKGGLTLPMEITLLQDGTKLVFSTYTKSFSLELPEKISGDFILRISIGDQNISRKISL